MSAGAFHVSNINSNSTVVRERDGVVLRHCDGVVLRQRDGVVLRTRDGESNQRGASV